MWQVATVVTTLFLTISTQASAGESLSRYEIQMPSPDHLGARTVAGSKDCDGCGSMIHMVANNQAPVAYFLDQFPTDLTLAGLAAEAKEVVIAKVRATESPSSLFGRDEVGTPATQMPRDKFFVRIKLLEVMRGSATVGAEYAIYFGEPGRKIIYPLSEDQLGREYVAVIYRDSSDAKYRLFGVPISSAQYTKWREEISNYRRSQLKKYKPNTQND